MKRNVHQQGFTIVEMLVATALFVILIGAVSVFLLLGYRTQTFTFQQSQAINETRQAIDQMTREIREATTGDDGSYLIERADDYQFVFFSDIDKDDETERVRYFMNPAGGPSGNQMQTCVSFTDGGSCTVTFSNYLIGGVGLNSAEVQISVEGDVDSTSETVDVDVEGNALGTLCTGSGECGQCAGGYEDLTTFSVITEAADDFLQLTADSSSSVNDFCDWQDPNHSIKAQFDFSWEEAAIPTNQAIFRKGLLEPTGFPSQYVTTNEGIGVVSENVVNELRGLPVFTYYDVNDALIADPNNNLEDIRRVHISFIVNIDLNRTPDDFSLESDIRLRNITD